MRPRPRYLDTVSVAEPQPIGTNPLVRLVGDLRSERSARVPFPPGDTSFDRRRTSLMLRDPLSLLLGAYHASVRSSP